MPRLTISKSAPDSLLAGKTATWTVTVSNTGGSTTSGVVTFTDTLPAGLTYVEQTEGASSLGCTHVDQTVTCTGTPNIVAGTSVTIKYTTSVASNATGNLINRVTLTNLGGDPRTPSGNATDPSSAGGSTQSTDKLSAKAMQTVTPLASLSISKILKTVKRNGIPLESLTGYQARSADVLIYEITVSNSGGQAGTTTIGETVPANTTYSGTLEEWDFATPNYSKSVTVNAGGTATKTFTVTVDTLADNIAQISNTVTSTSGTCASCVVNTPTAPRLSISKTAPDSLITGNTASWSVVITNNGGSATSGTVTFTDTLPTGLTFTAQTAGESKMTCTAASQVVTCTGTPDIAVGDNLTMTYTTAVANDAIGNKINAVLLTALGGDPRTPANNASDPTTAGSSTQGSDKLSAKAMQTATSLNRAILTLNKSGPAKVQVASSADYKITVSNVGNIPTSGVITVKDVLPAKLTFKTQTAGNDKLACTVSGQQMTCTGTPDIAPSSNVVIGYAVDIANDATGALINEVTFTALGNDGRTPNTAGLVDPNTAGGSTQSTDLLYARSRADVVPLGPPNPEVKDTIKPPMIGPIDPLHFTVDPIQSYTQPSCGYITAQTGAGSFTYTPTPSCRGQITFTVYTLKDGLLVPTVYTINVIDPAGVVYNSITRAPVQGARVWIHGPDTDALVPDSLLDTIAGTVNGALTPASGNYNLLLKTSGGSGRYYLTVVAPAGYKPSFSQIIPPQTTAYTPSLGGGIEFIQAQPAPPTASQVTTYYTDFNFTISTDPTKASNGIDRNHIPLDPIPVGTDQMFFSIAKTGSASKVELGDSLLYTINLTLTNSGTQANVQNNVVITDTLPLGFKYIPGTAIFKNGNQILKGDTELGINGVGPVLQMHLGSIATNPGQTINATLTYRVRVGVGSQNGTGINKAIARTANGLVSNESQFKVETSLGVFAQEGCIVGKVYLDCNGNGIQDKQDGYEPGVGGIRVYMEDGTYMVSDPTGAYSICGVQALTHVLKLDKTTLPAGATLGISANRNAGDPDSIFVDMKFGELHRADFIINSCAPALLDEVAKRGKSPTGAPSLDKAGSSKAFSSKQQRQSIDDADSRR